MVLLDASQIFVLASTILSTHWVSALEDFGLLTDKSDNDFAVFSATSLSISLSKMTFNIYHTVECLPSLSDNY